MLTVKKVHAEVGIEAIYEANSISKQMADDGTINLFIHNDHASSFCVNVAAPDQAFVMNDKGRTIAIY